MANDVYNLSRKQKAQVNKIDAANLLAISRAYHLHYTRLQGDIDALLLAIEAMDNPTQAEIKRLPQYRRLERDATRELDAFTSYLKTTIGTVGMAAVTLGLQHSSSLLKASGVAAQSLRPNVISPLLKFLDPEGPLYARLEFLTGSAVEKVAQAIIDGVGSGLNPRVIASQIESAFGGGLTDALRNTRTVQLWSYREAARANYTASGVVDGWIWSCEKDEDVCASCLAEDGTVHPLDEQLDGHYNCRCAAIPYIEGVTEQDQSGSDWFDNQSEDYQKGILGQGKWEAWKDGKFTLGDVIDHAPNDVYGQMLREKSLKELVGE